jgi:hypothetical protein
MRKFDLNIEKILENWEIYHAIREVIANALDEQKVTNTRDIEIFKDIDGYWHIRDYGRGIRYEKENEEKLNSQGLIGKFGIGLKDALATFDRKKIDILIKSRYGDITILKSSKEDFKEILTLHAGISDSSDKNMIGTDFIIKNVNEYDIQKAKNLFLKFSSEIIIEDTQYGQVLQKDGYISKIFINGVKVSEEDNFLFSYNITSLTASIKKALNRERTNVGRNAYSDRIKSILLSCNNWEIAKILTDDLRNYSYGKKHDELNWIDVQQHSLKILNKIEKVVFVTPKEIENKSDIIAEAKETGHSLVVIPENLKDKITGTNTDDTTFITKKEIEEDPSILEELKENQKNVIIVPEYIKEKSEKIEEISGTEIRDFSQYISKKNDNFEFSFVKIENLTTKEREVFNIHLFFLKLLEKITKNVKTVMVSETMQRDVYTYLPCEGIWDSSSNSIIIKRSVLEDRKRFISVLLHEIAHSLNNYTDSTRYFEYDLTDLLGIIGEKTFLFVYKIKLLEDRQNKK